LKIVLQLNYLVKFMKISKLLAILLTIWLIFTNGEKVPGIKAQDPEFTQFYANPLYLNPAFAGVLRCPRLVFNYRNQWPNIPGSFVTYVASYDQHVDALAGGVGLQVWTDIAGKTLRTTNASLFYSYHLPINRKFSLKFGVQGAWQQKSIDWSKLTFGDMIDPRRGFVYTTQQQQGANLSSVADFSAGVLAYTDIYFVGFAAQHLTEPIEGILNPNSAIAKLPRKYTLHAGAALPIESKGEPAKFSPNILFWQQGPFRQFLFGMYYSKGAMVGGLWYRAKDSFIALLGFDSDNFKFGYSYDITVSKLTMKTAGSHEISIGIKFDCKPKRRRFRTISCPSF
jgi:type IX secretion system PorP/SprF family membrane protein